MAEHVVKLTLDSFDPEPNVPEPVLIQSELVCYLIYNNRSGARRALQFERCLVVKFGYPNDEALGGHRLFGKGLGPYGCYEVFESEWINELQQNNKVTFSDKEIMVSSRHLIFTFHDSTFECVADGFKPTGQFPQVENSIMKVYGI